MFLLIRIPVATFLKDILRCVPQCFLFEYCELHSKRDSYLTAASTPQNAEFGYVFKNCKLTAAPGVKKVYLGRPWRPYAATVFINCEFGNHIRPEGWHNWKNPANEKTARYAEFGNTGDGAETSGRVTWGNTVIYQLKQRKNRTEWKKYSSTLSVLDRKSVV